MPHQWRVSDKNQGEASKIFGWCFTKHIQLLPFWGSNFLFFCFQIPSWLHVFLQTLNWKSKVSLEKTYIKDSGRNVSFGKSFTQKKCGFQKIVLQKNCTTHLLPHDSSAMVLPYLLGTLIWFCSLRIPPKCPGMWKVACGICITISTKHHSSAGFFFNVGWSKKSNVSFWGCRKKKSFWLKLLWYVQNEKATLRGLHFHFQDKKKMQKANSSCVLTNFIKEQLLYYKMTQKLKNSNSREEFIS